MKNSKYILTIGKESVGKSCLIHSLTGKYAYSSNFRGSTVSCDHYECESGETFIDAPGIFRETDCETTRQVLQKLVSESSVLLVAQATHLEEDLNDLLPLAVGKKGIVAVTFWDKVKEIPGSEKHLENLVKISGLPFIPVDARRLSDAERTEILSLLQTPPEIAETRLAIDEKRRVSPAKTVLENKFFGLLSALILILLPAVIAVWTANGLAGIIETPIKNLFAPVIDLTQNLPPVLGEILAGNYGFLTMFPLMFVWALPTVLLYAFLLGFYKASGLLERITAALHPLVRYFGIDGRDLVRVVMGFGCNVPAVVQTRSCSACSRETCVSAIAFGSACSYQFAATVGVFAAANKPYLVAPYLVYLLLTTLVFARLTAKKEALSKRNLPVIEGRTFLEMPSFSSIWREARSTVGSFLRQAIPIFLVITVIASALQFFGVVNWLAGVLSPLMSIFNLPPESSLPMLFSAIRKDGILLFAEEHAVNGLSSLQLLTAVYFAGVAVPCLVTAWTVKSELGKRFALKMLVRQIMFAVMMTLLLAWGGKLIQI